MKREKRMTYTSNNRDAFDSQRHISGQLSRIPPSEPKGFELREGQEEQHFHEAEEDLIDMQKATPGSTPILLARPSISAYASSSSTFGPACASLTAPAVPAR
jgi:hypothetical protein